VIGVGSNRQIAINSLISVLFLRIYKKNKLSVQWLKSISFCQKSILIVLWSQSINFIIGTLEFTVKASEISFGLYLGPQKNNSRKTSFNTRC